MEGSVYGVYDNTNRTIEEKLQEFMMVMARIGKYVTVTKYCFPSGFHYILVTMLCIASIQTKVLTDYCVTLLCLDVIHDMLLYEFGKKQVCLLVTEHCED